jgi:hypothetical protein
MGFGDMLGNIEGKAKAAAGLGNLDVGKIKDSLTSVDSGLKTLLELTNKSGAFDQSGAPKTKFAKFVEVIDKAVNALQYFESLKKVQAAPVSDAANAASGMKDNLGDLKKDLLAGNIDNQEDMKTKVMDLISQYKDEIKPLAGFDLKSLL